MIELPASCSWRSGSFPVANRALIRIGSQTQPFQVFLPRVDEPDNAGTLQLLANRYLPGDSVHPRRSYAYVTGRLIMFQDLPEVVVDGANQVADQPPV